MNLKQRMYGIGMGEGWVFISLINLLLYFIQGDTPFFKSMFIGANVTLIICGLILYLYSRYITKVEEC